MDSSGIQRQIHSSKLGKYAFYDLYNGRNGYKLVGKELYLHFTTSNVWAVCFTIEMHRFALNMHDDIAVYSPK